MGRHKKSRTPTFRKCSESFSDGLTSLRWYDPDQVQRVVPYQDSQFKNAPSDHVGTRLFHIFHKSRIIDLKIKKSTIHIMHSTPLWRVILMISLIGLGGCAMGSAHVNPYFEMPPDRLLKAELELYNRALEQLKKQSPGGFDQSLENGFLEHRPRSFRGYNNLGMAYYSNDQLEKSIITFETALTLETVLTAKSRAI